MNWRHLFRLVGIFVCALLATAASLRALESTEQLTPEASAALDRAVGWLVSNQTPEGTWPGKGGDSSGVVAACALALMSQGHLPGTGLHGVATTRAINYLIQKAQPDGLLYREEFGPYPMYHHGLATLALAEAWGQTSDPRTKEVLRKAVDLICGAQNQKGGWRYQPKIADDDLSVTVFQLMALRAARDAGLSVSKDVIDLGISYVKSCHNGPSRHGDGGFAYNSTEFRSAFARSGAGITSLQVAGDYRAQEVVAGIEYLVQFKPAGPKEMDGGNDVYYYGMYYSTMGIYQAQSLGDQGRKWWSTWYPAVLRDLVQRQQPDGHWIASFEAYDTAMAILVLSIPYRYLPIYQR